MIRRRRKPAAPDGSLRRWLRLSVAMSPVVAALVTLPIVSASPARAQTPGVPQAPAVVFDEDFEHNPSPTPLPLPSYVGVNGETYTADPAWLTSCNGEIVNYTMTALPANCNAGSAGMNSLRSMAYALGVIRGASNPTTNNALSAYTDLGNNTPVDPGAGKVQFQTNQPIALPDGTTKHYILFSVDAASVNCPGNPPLLQFNLISGTTVIPDGNEINTCQDPRGGFVTAPYPPGGNLGVYTGRYTASAAIPFTGSSLVLQMINNQGLGNGNDSAVDNISVLDATPQLSKSFSPDTQVAGLPTQLTFTITNTSDLLAKPGWSFTDALPSGMTVAAPANASTNCANGSVNATSGGTSIGVSGDLAAGDSSCTVTIDVTGAAGHYVNGAGNVTANGVHPPEDTPVTFVAPNPHISVTKTPSPATANEAGNQVTYSFVVTNDGNVDLTNIDLTDQQSSPAGGLDSGPTCPSTSLAVGASMTCTATYTLTQADVDHGSVDDSARVTGNPPAILGLPPAVGTATAAVTVASAPELTISKTVSPTTVTAADQQVTYSVDVTNTGNVTIDNLAIDETAFSGTGTPPSITCPVGTLAPGDHTTCTATYNVTLADIDAGTVTNTARAIGAEPNGTEVESGPSTAMVTANRAPALTMTKEAAPTTVNEADQQVTYSFVVTNEGNVTVHGIGIDETAFSGTGTPPSVSCPLSTLAPGEHTTCTATYAVTQADIDAGTVTNTAHAVGTAPDNSSVESASDSATVTATSAPELTLVKTASPSAPSSFRADQEVTYSFAVTNTGNVTVHGIVIDETAFSGTGSLSAITCPVTTLAPGEHTTCTATYTLTTADIDAGRVTNTAHASGTAPDNSPVDSLPDSAEVTANQAPELALVKTASLSGNVITYSFAVTNTGNVTVHDLAINETAFSGTGTAPSAQCPVTTLAPSATTTCTTTYTVTTADIDAGRVTNTAVAAGSTSGGPAVSLPSSAEVTLTQAPALEMTKLAPAGPMSAAGQQITYRFVVANTGNVTIHDVAINETAFSGAGTAPSVTCPVTTLAPDTSTVCTGTYTVTQEDIDAGSVTNTAHASGTAPDNSTVDSPPDSAEVTASQAPELTLVKTVGPSAASSFRSGQQVTYSFVVTNTGNVTVHGITINEMAFSGTGSLSAINCPVTTLVPGEHTTCTATYTLTTADIDAGKVTNTAHASGTAPDNSPVDSLPDSAEVTANQAPELALVKTASLSGNVITYSFAVTNTGNTTINGLAIDEIVFSGTGTRPTAQCAATTLAPGAATTCTATYTVTTADIDAGHDTNTAVATGTSAGGAHVTSPSATADVPLAQTPALTVLKTASLSGDVVSYRFVVTNTGNTTIGDLAVNETSFSGTGTVPSVHCAVTTLAPGTATVCTATYTLTQTDIDAGRVTNSAVAVGTAPSGLPVISLPSEAEVTITQNPALALVKSVSPSSPSSFRAGQQVTYSFAVTNTGNVTIHDIAIDETAFSGTGSMSAINCPVTTLAPGEHTTCTATYTLTQADIDAGAVTNTAHASGTGPGGSSVTSPPASAAIPVVHAPELSLSKTAVPATVTTVGQRITYSFTVANIGNVTVHGIAVHETAFSGTGSLSAISCPVTALAPGDSVTCTATYVVNHADIAAGKIANTAVATGALPTGKAVTSQPSTATVAVHKPGPGIIVSGVPGAASGPSVVEIGSGIGLILAAASALTGLVVVRRRRGTWL